MKKGHVCLTLLLCAVLLTSRGTAGASYNTLIEVGDVIASATRTAVSAANEATLKSLRAGEMLSPVIATPDKPYTPTSADEADSGRVEAFSPDVTLADIVTGEGKPLDEIYIVFGKHITADQRIEVAEPGYAFTLTPYAPEMYVVLTAFERGAVTYLLYTAYAKTDTGWQLYGIRYDEYAYEGMDATALYAKAEELSGKKQPMPAAVYAYCAGQVLTPCGIVSDGNKAISADIEPLVNAVNTKYKFPYKLLVEEEKPEMTTAKKDPKTVTLFGFEPVVNEGGISVGVRYFIDIDIKDVVAAKELEEKQANGDEEKTKLSTGQTAKNDRTKEKLSDEAALVLQYIDKSFPDITREFGTAHLVAYNRFEVKPEKPSGLPPSNLVTQTETAPEYEYIYYITVAPTNPKEGETA